MANVIPESRVVLDRTLKDGRHFKGVLRWNGELEFTVDGELFPRAIKLPKPVKNGGKTFTHASGNVAISETEWQSLEGARREWRATLFGQRCRLVQALCALSSDEFPGSPAWKVYKMAEHHLATFDCTFPEVKAALNAKIAEIANEQLEGKDISGL